MLVLWIRGVSSKMHIEVVRDVVESCEQNGGELVLRFLSSRCGSRSKAGERRSGSVEGPLGEATLQVLDPEREGLDSGVLVELVGTDASLGGDDGVDAVGGGGRENGFPVLGNGAHERLEREAAMRLVWRRKVAQSLLSSGVQVRLSMKMTPRYVADFWEVR